MPGDLQTIKEKNYWVLKTVTEEERASKTIDSYNDKFINYYNYDNLIPNSKQIQPNDIIILIDKEKILGFASIDHINSKIDKKTIRRCPQCPSTTIDLRKTKTPKYRCNKGHEFEMPKEEVRSVEKYRAIYNSFMPYEDNNNGLALLRPYYIQGYNQNMSMQKLDSIGLKQFGDIESLLKKHFYKNLFPEEGFTNEPDQPYINNEKDERINVLQAIKLRRGQQAFRNKLLKKYKNTCAITGCKIIDILEAAHIAPYRGENDNHPDNGILMRADIHTLFDLNLIFINPETIKLEISNKLINTEYKKFNAIDLEIFSLSKSALKIRWDIFNK